MKVGDYTVQTPNLQKDANNRCDAIYSGDIDPSSHLPIWCDKLLWQLVLIISIITVILTLKYFRQADLKAKIA